MSWASVAIAGIGLAGTTVGVVSKETTHCGKVCRAKCRTSKGFLGIGEKRKCKKDCKSECFREPVEIKEQELRLTAERQAQAKKNALLIVIVILSIAFITGIVIVASRQLKTK